MDQQEYQKYEDEIEPRMDNLYKNKQFLELVALMSVILEKDLQDTNSKYEELINILLEEHNIKFSIENFKSKDKMTLGQLKKYLTVYCDNKEIIDKIEDFNKLRIKTVHKIFSHNISKLEVEIEDYYKRDFFKLMFNLSDLRVRLLNEIVDKRGKFPKEKVLLKKVKSKKPFYNKMV